MMGITLNLMYSSALTGEQALFTTRWGLGLITSYVNIEMFMGFKSSVRLQIGCVYSIISFGLSSCAFFYWWLVIEQLERLDITSDSDRLAFVTVVDVMSPTFALNVDKALFALCVSREQSPTLDLNFQSSLSRRNSASFKHYHFEMGLSYPNKPARNVVKIVPQINTCVLQASRMVANWVVATEKPPISSHRINRMMQKNLDKPLFQPAWLPKISFQSNADLITSNSSYELVIGRFLLDMIALILFLMSLKSLTLPVYNYLL